MSKLGVKVKLGKQCRRFRISEDMKLSDFNGRLEALFSTRLTNTATRYQDDDKDWINIDTEEEFTEAKLLILSTENKILKIEISQKEKEKENGENKTDLEKFVLNAIDQCGNVLDTEKLKELYSKVQKEVKEVKAQSELSKFIQEIGSVFSEFSLSSRNSSEISKEMKKEFTVDINKGNGSVNVFQGQPKQEKPKVVKPKTLGATLVGEEGVQSDTEIEQETVFKKIWKIKNTGDCDWKEGSHLKFIGGSSELNIPKESKFQISKLAKVGETVDVIVELVAPKEPSNYNAYFSLVSEKGKFFGSKLLLEFLVVQNKALLKWGEKLKFLAEMGFTDSKHLIILLEKNNGDLPTTIQDHLAQ